MAGDKPMRESFVALLSLNPLGDDYYYYPNTYEYFVIRDGDAVPSSHVNSDGRSH